MIDPSLALQTAVRHVLTTDAAVIAEVPIEHIVDSTGQLAKFPAVVIGEGQTIGEFVTLKRDTTRVYLDLHVWTSSDDLAAAKLIAGVIRGALSNVASWSLDGYRVTDIFIQSCRYLRDHEGETPLAHAVLTINALLQDAA